MTLELYNSCWTCSELTRVVLDLVELKWGSPNTIHGKFPGNSTKLTEKCCSWESPIKFHWADGEIARNCLKCVGNSYKIPLRLLRNFQKLSTPLRLLRNSQKLSMILRKCQWISLSLLRNSQKLSTSEIPRQFPWAFWEIPHNCPLHLGNSHRVPLTLLRNSQRLSTTPGKLPENLPEPTEKFPEIVPYPWEIPRKSSWGYWEISRNCPLSQWNSKRISLNLLRNSQKMTINPGKFPENSPESTEKFPEIVHCI